MDVGGAIAIRSPRALQTWWQHQGHGVRYRPQHFPTGTRYTTRECHKPPQLDQLLRHSAPRPRTGAWTNPPRRSPERSTHTRLLLASGSMTSPTQTTLSPWLTVGTEFNGRQTSYRSSRLSSKWRIQRAYYGWGTKAPRTRYLSTVRAGPLRRFTLDAQARSRCWASSSTSAAQNVSQVHN